MPDVIADYRAVDLNDVQDYIDELGAAWALGKPIVAVLTDPAVRSKIPIEAHQLSIVHVGDPKEPGVVDRILEKLHPNGQWHL